MQLTIKDVEILQQNLAKEQEDYQIELQEGNLLILINPDERTVSVYRPNGEIETLTGDDKLTITELFPGWEINISEIWPPVFE